MHNMAYFIAKPSNETLSIRLAKFQKGGVYMEATGRSRLRECQIEQERRYERARAGLTRFASCSSIQKSYCISTDVRRMKRLTE